MKNKSFGIIIKILFSLSVIAYGVYSINYLGFFDKVKKSLDFTSVGISLGGTTYSRDFSTILAYLGIIALIVLVVYYFDKHINMITKKSCKK